MPTSTMWRKPRHWFVFVGFLVLVCAIAFLPSRRGFGYPSPKEAARSVSDLAVQSAAERDMAIMRLTLQALDFLARAKPADAIRACDLLLEIDPTNVNGVSVRGNAYLQLGRYAQALKDANRLIGLAPGESSAYRLRGLVYATLQRDNDALADYAHAMQLLPGDVFARELRGHLYLERGRYALAIADFSALIAAQPLLARAWNSRCWTRVIANTAIRAALADCDTAVRLDPKAANAYDSRGFARLRLRLYASAIKDFDRALLLDRRLASSLLGRGIARLALRQAAGRGDIRAAKTIDPNIELRFARFGFKVPVGGPAGS